MPFWLFDRIHLPPRVTWGVSRLVKALQSFAVIDGMAGVLLRPWMATLHLRRGAAHQREIPWHGRLLVAGS